MKKKNLMKLCTVAAAVALAAAGCASKGDTADTTAAAQSSQAQVSQNDTENTQSGQGAETEQAEGVTMDETVKKSAPKGIFEDFKAQDLDGNEVTQAIFADHDITLINVWATFCGPCLSEMPELGELSAEYSDKGLQIVGIVADVLDGPDQVSSSQLDEAKSIVEKTKASYLHIVPVGDLANTLLPQVPAVPTTFFVDKDGKQIGKPIVGARSKADWVKLIDKTLKEAGAQ